MLDELAKERVGAAQYRAECRVAVETLEMGMVSHFADVDGFRKRVKETLAEQEQRMRKLSIAYDEELYPLLLSAVAERRLVRFPFFLELFSFILFIFLIF